MTINKGPKVVEYWVELAIADALGKRSFHIGPYPTKKAAQKYVDNQTKTPRPEVTLRIYTKTLGEGA